LPSGEKATALTQPEWPLSVCRCGFQYSDNPETHETQCGISSEKFFLIMLVFGLNIRPAE
jgi:hypothetical protein